MPTRRTFLRLVPAPLLALFVPAPVTAAPTAAPPPAPAPRVYDREHDPDADFCWCDSCERARWAEEDHELACRAVAALEALHGALGRLTCSHAHGQVGCDTCADAEALRYVIEYAASAIDCAVIHPDAYHHDYRRAARRHVLAADPGEAVVIALYDALDALLDLTAGHCPRWDCHVCLDADPLVHHVRTGIDLLGAGLPATVPGIERALLSARRKMAREAEDGAPLTPFAARENGGGEDEMRHCEILLAILRARAAE